MSIGFSKFLKIFFKKNNYPEEVPGLIFFYLLSSQIRHSINLSYK